MMRIATFVAIMLATGAALAAEPVSYKLSVTPAQLNEIGAALALQPWGQVNTLIVDLQNQRIAQQTKPEKPKEAAPK
jgi:hypothetical protein